MDLKCYRCGEFHCVCAGSVMDARGTTQFRRGGSIPASALFFQAGRVAEAKELITRFHYSKRWPSNVQFVGTLHRQGGLLGDSGECVAAICYSIPPTKWSEVVWELSRLVRRNDCPGVPLTMLIRLSLSRIRKDMDLVVSFADRTHGHHGGIYQAAGWNYDGRRERAMDGIVMDGRFMPGRSCNSTWGTRSPEKLRTLFPTAAIEPHYDEGKHLYWKPLSKSGRIKAERLGLTSKHYPKPKIAS